jgi:hypothetical protein
MDTKMNKDIVEEMIEEFYDYIQRGDPRESNKEIFEAAYSCLQRATTWKGVPYTFCERDAYLLCAGYFLTDEKNHS